MQNITPQLATSYLSTNHGNRVLRERLVLQYATDMEAGRWRLTHQGIAFDEHGVLLDGQHRLEAIVLSGCTVPMLVTLGVKRCGNDGVDVGAIRGFKDAAWFGGAVPDKVEYRNWYAAVLRGMLTTAFNGNRIASIPRLIELAPVHHDAVLFAIDVFSNGHKWPRGTKGAFTMGPVARAFYSVPHDRLRQFGAVLQSGMAEDKGDEAAIKLRTYLMLGTSDHRQMVARKCARALLAFVNRQGLAKLYESGTIPFSIEHDIDHRHSTPNVK